MRTTKIIIADDEPLGRQRIRRLLGRNRNVAIVAECGNGKDAVNAILERQPDLVFLDIQMPDLDGFGVLEAIRGKAMPIIIFSTAYDQYALKAFEVSVLDYLLKPYDNKRFYEALSRAEQKLEENNTHRFADELLKVALNYRQERSSSMQYLTVNINGVEKFTDIRDVDYFKTSGNYVEVHSNKTSFLYRSSIARIESELDPDNFTRIHRSLLVNINKIKRIEYLKNDTYKIVTANNDVLVSGRTYKNNVSHIDAMT